MLWALISTSAGCEAALMQWKVAVQRHGYGSEYSSSHVSGSGEPGDQFPPSRCAGR